MALGRLRPRFLGASLGTLFEGCCAGVIVESSWLKAALAARASRRHRRRYTHPPHSVECLGTLLHNKDEANMQPNHE